MSAATRRLRGVILLPILVLGAGCAPFAANPPLPQRAAIETAAAPREPDEFTKVVERADVFYLAADRAAWALREDSGWKLIDALRRGGAFAIGWDAIDTDQQRLLDEAPRTQVAGEDSISRLAFAGSASEREHGRELLRRTHLLGVAQIALRFPQQLSEKLRRGEPLNASERETLPTGFRAPANSDGSSTDSGAAMVRSEFVAEIIVRRLRAHPGEKLLIFIQRSELDAASGAPLFVAQKSNVRQLVLESKQPSKTRTRLLTRNDLPGVPRLFEIEDRAPRTRSDDL